MTESIDIDNLRQLHAANAYVAFWTAAYNAMPALLDELERLRAWKQDALEVIERWERCFEAAGSPGKIGSQKSQSTEEEIKRLVAAIRSRKESIVGLQSELGVLRGENGRLLSKIDRLRTKYEFENGD